MSSVNVTIFEYMIEDTLSKHYLSISEQNRRDYIEMFSSAHKNLHVLSILEAYDWFLEGKDISLIKGYLVNAPFINWPFIKGATKKLNIIGNFNGYIY